jgi:hypothetical protein
MITDNARKNEESCEFAHLFHYYILVEFKKVQNKILTSNLKQDLSNKTEKKINEYMSPGLTSLAADSLGLIILPTNGNTDQKFQIKENSSANS